jgi:DNA primase
VPRNSQRRANRPRAKQRAHPDRRAREGCRRAIASNSKASPRAIDYLKGRGLSGEIARSSGLGYAPKGWRSLAEHVSRAIDDPLLEESGFGHREGRRRRRSDGKRYRPLPRSHHVPDPLGAGAT